MRSWKSNGIRKNALNARPLILLEVHGLIERDQGIICFGVSGSGILVSLLNNFEFLGGKGIREPSTF